MPPTPDHVPYSTRAARPRIRARRNRKEVSGLRGWVQDGRAVTHAFLGCTLAPEWGHRWIEQRLRVAVGSHMRGPKDMA